MCIAGTQWKHDAKQYIILIQKFTKPPENAILIKHNGLKLIKKFTLSV